MKHLEATNVHHDLGGRKSIIFDTNVARLFDFLQSRHNRFVITSLNVPLHNIVTQQMVATEVTYRLLKAFKTGERLYQEFRNERFKAKTVKLSATISKISLPRFDIHVTGDKFLIHKPLQKHATNLKQVTAAQHIVEIAKERGKTILNRFCLMALLITALFLIVALLFPAVLKPKNPKIREKL